MGNLISQSLPVLKNNLMEQYLCGIKPLGVTGKAN